MMNLANRDGGKVWRPFLLCLLFSAMGSGSVLADDFQYRLKAENVAGVGENWMATLSLESRHDDDGSQIHQHTDIGAMYIGLARWFDVGLRFRTIFRDIGESDWIRENRYYLDMVGRHSLFDVGFSHRARLEYNDWESSVDDFGTFRYRIAINPPHTLSKERERRVLKNRKYRPYANYELTATSLDEKITRHAFELGVTAELTESMIGNLYFLHEENGSEIEQPDLDSVGLTVKVLL
jgi:hypothetical protein